MIGLSYTKSDLSFKNNNWEVQKKVNKNIFTSFQNKSTKMFFTYTKQIMDK